MSNVYDRAELEFFFRAVFDMALKDVNVVIAATNILTEPEDVSFDSFHRFILQNHTRVLQIQQLDTLSMELYKKALDDIAFQSDEYRCYLREIPLRTQQESCESAIENLNIYIAERMPSHQQQAAAVKV